MSKVIKSWWLAIVSIFGAMMYAYDLISRAIDFGIIENKYFGILGLLLFLLSGSIVVAKAQYTTNEFLKSKPVVKIKDYGIEQKGFRGNLVKDTLFIDFYNDSEGKTSESDAVDIYANVIWYDINGKVAESNSGRWWIPFPNEQKDKLSQQTITLKSNGMPRKFHFAIKEEKLNAWYRTQDGFDKKNELGKKYYKVEITLKGINVKSVFVFFVDNKKGKLSLRSTSKPAT